MQTFAARFLVILSICIAFVCNAKEPSVAIEIDSSRTDEKTIAVWLGYLLSRQAYRVKHNSPLPTSGEITPSFDEEVSGRNTGAQIYQELKEKDKSLRDLYWEQLSQIKAKGLMAAYVWIYLHRSQWPKNEAPNNLAVFEAWKKTNLQNHKAVTIGRLSVRAE